MQLYVGYQTGTTHAIIVDNRCTDSSEAATEVHAAAYAKAATDASTHNVTIAIHIFYFIF